jgi:hypothetical protein
MAFEVDDNGSRNIVAGRQGGEIINKLLNKGLNLASFSRLS